MTFDIDNLQDLTGQVAVITGGNAGIGEICSQRLAKHGAKVYVLSRSKQRYDEALQRCKEYDASQETSKRWHYVQCDLADLETVKAAAETIKSSEDHLDMLINNAGIMAVPYGYTKQGLELQCGTNVVGHALLSFMLLPLLVTSARKLANTGRSVRMVQLSSIAHQKYGKPYPKHSWENLEKVNSDCGGTWGRYGKSKVGNILLANELQKLTAGENISHLSVHPGMVNTGLYDGLDKSYGVFGKIARIALTKILLVTPAQGASSSIYAATSAEIDEKKLNGTYFDPLTKIGKKEPWAEDKDGVLGKQLIDFSSKFCQEKVGINLEVVGKEALASK